LIALRAQVTDRNAGNGPQLSELIAEFHALSKSIDRNQCLLTLSIKSQ
jgi:hypothetical protein